MPSAEYDEDTSWEDLGGRLQQPLSPLLTLPSELIHNILTFIQPSDLAYVSQTCKLLAEHAYDERLWRAHIIDVLPHLKSHKNVSNSYRKQFLLHHPYWFIPKYKIWHSDTTHTGRLLIARYSPKRQCIEAYALAAERPQSTFEFWDWNPEVIIHSFDPKVQLDFNVPVVKIDADAVANIPQRKRFSEEVVMDTHGGSINSRLCLTRPLPEAAISTGTKVWPPMKLPAASRVRNESQDSFRSAGHLPTSAAELSEHTFRLRRWMDFPSRLQGFRGMTMRMGEDVSTFATLPPEAYTPTKAKPWRGIWVGDYSGHGCEFLVVLQPDENVELPEDARAALIRRRHSSLASEQSENSYQTALSSHANTPPNGEPSDLAEPEFDYEHLFEGTEDLNLTAEMGLGFDAEFAQSSSRIDEAPETSEDENVYEGQLLGIKLTGDPNIPRGEYTFVAPDISDAGLLRVADEEIFAGARVVKSAGHIAARDFRDDIYIPSQLILISHDTLAQYWEAFGHVSLYRRVNIDDFINVD